MRSLLAVALPLGSLLTGCYLMHEREAPSGIEAADAGALPDARVITDAGTAADAGPPPGCTLTRVREERIADDPGTTIQAPDLFWTGERIGALVFESRSVGHPVVSMTHVDRELRDAAPLRRVGEEAHGWGEATWTGDSVGLCWNGDPDGRATLRFREIAGLDGSLGSRVDFGVTDGPCLDLVFAHGRYGMTWRVQRREGDTTLVETAFRVFDRDMAPVGERHLLAEGEYPGFNGVVAEHPEGFVHATADGERVRVILVDRAGRVARERSLDAPGAVFAHVDVREGRLGVLSLRGPRETRALVFTLLDETLAPVAERVLEDGAPTASNARVIARPEGWVVVWGQGSRPTFRTMVLSLDADAVPLAPRQVLYDGNNSSYGAPSLLSIDDSVYVGLSHPEPADPTGRESVYVQRWDCDAPPDDPCRPQRASASDCARGHLVGWRWTGTDCEPVIGCDGPCLGPDCERLATTRFACLSDRRECMPRSCRPAAAAPRTACGPVEVASNQLSSVVTLAAEVEACPCVPAPTCRARVTGPLELSLDLLTCGEDLPECDCAPGPARSVEVECMLPPMQAGTWVLSAPGGEPFELRVRPPWEPPTDEDLCRDL